MKEALESQYETVQPMKEALESQYETVQLASMLILESAFCLSKH
jgi:hypothetical protein